MSIRPERVAQRMRRDIAEILEHQLRDPRIGALVSVTDVEITRDLSFARVFVSVLASGKEQLAVLEGLRHAAGFVRHELGPRLGLREVPELRFELDTSLDRGARVDAILKRIESGEPIEDPEDE